ncbi:carbon-nitrogen hydrolase family protein [Pseudochrobactrum sp. HB0163]|uniref:carbon-nitrogen hydrolase family protein n=1 Tax=Pseudochrobactrum sp. HB0163 TaxID=3450708 RepID=UPI003F6DDFB1
MLHLASCQYVIELIRTWDDYEQHLRDLCSAAVRQGAKVLLLPEYAGLVLSGQLPEEVRSDLHGSIAAIQPLLPRWLALCEAIAREHQIVLQPGSAPVLDRDGKYRNRAWLFGPDGLIGHQDKIIMTRFEREQWGISGGVEDIRSFATPFGHFGILICYDNEFPMLARRLGDQGAELILAPSCTDTLAGYYRVRIGAQARALENQFAVLVSPTAGEAPWSPALDENCGRAALYVPSDYGMPPSGVYAESAQDIVTASRWMHCSIDLAQVRRLRQEGQVFTHRDWPEQFKTAAPV